MQDPDMKGPPCYHLLLFISIASSYPCSNKQVEWNTLGAEFFATPSKKYSTLLFEQSQVDGNMQEAVRR